MPTYCYKCPDCGNVFDNVSEYEHREEPRICDDCGGLAPYDFAETAKGVGTKAKGWARGHRSLAMGVHPSQAKKEEAYLRKATGFSDICVDPDGAVRTFSQKQKVAAAAAISTKDGGKMVDLDGGYTS